MFTTLGHMSVCDISNYCYWIYCSTARRRSVFFFFLPNSPLICYYIYIHCSSFIIEFYNMVEAVLCLLDSGSTFSLPAPAGSRALATTSFVVSVTTTTAARTTAASTTAIAITRAGIIPIVVA